jgi:toxin HigB-1
MLIDNAEKEIDFMVPPSNKYEHLKGDRKSESSIRINDQWRITFKYKNGNAYNVCIEDYH